MVTVELPNGKLYVSDKFSYTRQVGDIGDVATSNANFTNSFNARRDKLTIRALDGLSLPSSTSRVPYRRIQSMVKINGVDVINDGWFQVKESNKDNFKISVLDGNVDFWKAIEGVTLADIDLSESIHDKNLANVIASFNNPYYKYILADYGGETSIEGRFFNIDHLPPAISENYIFRRIFKYIGMSYIMPINIDTWLTYPKDTSDNLGFETATEMSVDGYINDFVGYGNGRFDVPLSLDVSNNGSILIGNNGVTNLEQGYYQIITNHGDISASYLLEDRAGNVMGVNLPVKKMINVSGELYTSDINAIDIDPSDTISFEFYALDRFELTNYGYTGYDIINVNKMYVGNFKAEIQRYIFQEIDFSDALKNVKATDFIKYIMHRYGLTLFYNNNQVDFRTVQQRLDANSVDYSDWFKERDTERYTYSNYAQQNRLAHKYVDDDKGFNDGIIYVDNKNLKEEITLLESFTYSPTRENQLTIFEKEVKEVDGIIEIEYKGVDRNFSVKYTMINPPTPIRFYSIIELGGEVYYNGPAPFLNVEGTTFKEYKNMYWVGIERILNNSKVHVVTFRMSIYEFLHIDLKKKLYLRQEASEYLINSAKLKGNQEVVMELIKLD